MPMLKTDDGVQLHYEEAGRGTPVVFVHGYGSRLEAWRAVQPRVARHRRTLSFDQRGFGQSERPPAQDDAGYGVVGHARDLLALLDEEGLERVVLVGHSYGASVVLQAALEAPGRVAGIVLVSPFVLDAQKNAFLRWAELPLMGEWLYTTSFRDFAGEKMLLAFAEPYKYATREALLEIEQNQRLPGTTYAALATVRGMDFDEAKYAQVTQRGRVPLTLVWGKQDRVTPIRTAPAVQKALGAPTSEVGVDAEAAVALPARGAPVLVKIDGAGHMPPWESPDVVAGAILDVLARADAAEGL